MGVAALPAARSGGGRPRLPAVAVAFAGAGLCVGCGCGVWGGGERLAPARPRRAAAASGPGEARTHQTLAGAAAWHATGSRTLLPKLGTAGSRRSEDTPTP